MRKIVVKKSQLKRNDFKTIAEFKEKRKEELGPSGGGSKRRFKEWMASGQITKRVP